MSNDFDDFPVYDPVIKQGKSQLSDLWVGVFSTFYQTLISYLTSSGIIAPELTTLQRNALLSPKNGQIIYNTTLNKFQGFENGAWVNLV
jgi:hypothetical protein